MTHFGEKTSRGVGGHLMPKWRHINVDATPSHRIDVNTTSFYAMCIVYCLFSFVCILISMTLINTCIYFSGTNVWLWSKRANSYSRKFYCQTFLFSTLLSIPSIEPNESFTSIQCGDTIQDTHKNKVISIIMSKLKSLSKWHPIQILISVPV